MEALLGNTTSWTLTSTGRYRMYQSLGDSLSVVDAIAPSPPPSSHVCNTHSVICFGILQAWQQTDIIDRQTIFLILDIHSTWPSNEHTYLYVATRCGF